jgi:hypothetical protein
MIIICALRDGISAEETVWYNGRDLYLCPCMELIVFFLVPVAVIMVYSFDSPTINQQGAKLEVENTTAQLHENSTQTSIHNQQLIGKTSLLQFTQNFTYAAWKQDLPSPAGLGTYIQIEGTEHCSQLYSSAI